MDRELVRQALEKKWDYRYLTSAEGNWQIYVPKGLLHIAQVKNEKIARLIVEASNSFRLM